MNKKDFKNWVKDIKSMNKGDSEYLKEKSQKSISYLRYFGLGLLSIISFLIIFGFIFMYFRVKKAIYHKRIL